MAAAQAWNLKGKTLGPTPAQPAPGCRYGAEEAERTTWTSCIREQSDHDDLRRPHRDALEPSQGDPRSQAP